AWPQCVSWSPISTRSFPSALRTAADSKSGLRWTAARVPAWIVARSPRWAQKEKSIAICSHSALRPWRSAPTRSGTRPAASAMHRMLVVRQTRARLMRAGGEGRVTAANSFVRSPREKPLREYFSPYLAQYRTKRLLLVLVVREAGQPLAVAVPDVQHGQRVELPPQRQRQQGTAHQVQVAQVPDDVAHGQGDAGGGRRRAQRYRALGVQLPSQAVQFVPQPQRL